MVVNLKCSLCKYVYNFEVGEPFINNIGKLVFENKSICPNCQAKDKDLLTEIGQSQMTAWDLGIK